MDVEGGFRARISGKFSPGICLYRLKKVTKYLIMTAGFWAEV